MTSKAQRKDIAKDVEPDVVSGYLKQPYARLVIPEEDGSFRAEILEFPGCIAIGESSAEALGALEQTARSWLAAVLARKQNIPAPIETGGFSGKLVLRIPKGLHRKASRVAEREGVSLNHFIACALAESVGERAKAGAQNSINITFSPQWSDRQNLEASAREAGYFVLPPTVNIKLEGVVHG